MDSVEQISFQASSRCYWLNLAIPERFRRRQKKKYNVHFSLTRSPASESVVSLTSSTATVFNGRCPMTVCPLYMRTALHADSGCGRPLPSCSFEREKIKSVLLFIIIIRN